MSLFVLGINHQTAPVALRERVAFDDDAVAPALAGLHALPQVREVALLSTCNRTELYAVTDDDGQSLADWLATHPTDGGDLHAYLYRHRDGDAVRHLFRVATGLDSLVLGEPQILGQVKHAWAAARGAGTLGGQLDRLFQHAFVTAKRARTETRIGNSPVSVASVAVRLAQESFAQPSDSVVLLIGAGETIELAARHLAQANVKQLLVANRTYAHAQELAARHGGVALPLDELDRHLFLADIVFSATASREPILSQGAGRGRARRAQAPADAAARPRRAARHRPGRGRRSRTPSSIPSTTSSASVEDNRRGRREAADAAESIVELQVARYIEVLAAGTRNAPLKRLRAHGEAARADVLAKARQQLAAGQSPDAVLDFLAHTLTNRLLHAPTVALRQAAITGDTELMRAVDHLLHGPDADTPGKGTQDDRDDDAADAAP